MKRFFTLLAARNREFLRDRAALAWNLIFPILVIFGFAFSFTKGSQDIFKTVVVYTQTDENGQPKRIQDDFFKTQYVQFIESVDLNEALAKLKRHQVDLVLSPDKDLTGAYWINSTSPKGYLLEKILLESEKAFPHYQKQEVSGQEIRYVDWLISGLLAMNMMFSALFGVGYVIVRYRKNGVLKRLRATPLTAFEFLLAQVVSRLILIVFATSLVYAGSHFFIHFKMLGSYFDLFVVMTLGAMCLISLSLLVASRTASEEFAGGFLNLVSWPMMFLSGVWFSLEGAQPWVKKAAQIFPLTHVIDASRAIMTEGATLSQMSTHIIVLASMTVVFLAVGSFAFRWK